jgi:HEPN domain-containing protein
LVAKPKSEQVPPPAGILPFGHFLGNDHPHAFARLGDDYLQAAKMLNEGFKGAPESPVYQNAFQALELYLKGYLRMRAVSVEDLQKKFGHRLRDALKEAKAKGLNVSFDSTAEEMVMEVSTYYTDTQLRYTAFGEWPTVPPFLVIKFVEQVRRDARL